MRDDSATGAPVRLDARPHGIALVAPLGRAIAMAVVGVALVVVGGESFWPVAALGAAVAVVAALAALRAVVAWDRTRLLVTGDELVIVHGVVRRRSAVARLGALEVEQPLLGRLLGYGTLVAGDLEVPYVPGAGRLAGRA